MSKMALISIACPACKGDVNRKVTAVRLSPIWTDSFLLQCRKCGLHYVSPRPSPEEENLFYETEYHGREDLSMWKEHRLPFFREALEKMERKIQGRRLLDVGCGAGFFLDLARKRGWETHGVEISKEASSYAQEILHLNVVRGALGQTEFPKGYFSVLTLWNVLDQMTHPDEEVRMIYPLIKPGGLFALRISNLSCHLMVHRFWKILTTLKLVDGKRNEPTVFHLQMFSKSSITSFLKSRGFVKIEVQNALLDPMPADLVGHLGQKGTRFARKAYYVMAEFLRWLSFGQIVLGPSLLVFARKPEF